MVVPRVFSTEGVSPFDQVEWDLRTAEIKDESGPGDLPADRLRDPQGLEPARHQRRGEQVFLRRESTPPERETSVRQLVDRVTRTIADWGREDGYFATAEDAERFYDELTVALPEPVRLVQLAGLVQRRPLPPLRDRRPGQQLAVGRGDPDGRQGRRAPTSTRRRRPASSRASPTTWQDIMRLAHRRGHAVQVRLGDRHRPLDPAVEPGEARRRRQAVRARSASCGSTTRSPASSSRAARPAAPPRCRPSRSGTPTSSNSSSARPRRRRRPRP